MQRFRATTVITCDEDFRVFNPGVVDVDDGRVAWVGSVAEAPEGRFESEHVLAGILMPGLVNTHCHSPMTLFRGAAEDVTLERFLREILWPREARLTEEDVYWGMLLASAELLRSGVTTCCEMYIHEAGMVAAIEESGIRSIVTPGVVEAPGWEHFGGWQQRLESIVDFYEQHSARSDRVEIGIAAHSAYALPLEALKAVAVAAKPKGGLLHIHVAETQEEGRELEERYDKTVPALLAELGFFEGRTIAAHSVWLTDDDIDIYRAHGVGVAHCPQSNAKLAAGIARLNDMLDAGLNVGLGTDGPASNNNLDLWEEIQLCALLARLRTGLPHALSAQNAISLATIGGARALGRADIGALEKGRWADMILVRTDDPAFVPVIEDKDVISHLAWSATSRMVTDVWVAGRRTVAEGRCISVDAVAAAHEVQQRARRLAS